MSIHPTRGHMQQPPSTTQHGSEWHQTYPPWTWVWERSNHRHITWCDLHGWLMVCLMVTYTAEFVGPCWVLICENVVYARHKPLHSRLYHHTWGLARCLVALFYSV